MQQLSSMRSRSSKAQSRSLPDYDFYRRRYAKVWKPGCERVQMVTRLLEARGIRFEADGFMAESTAWAQLRPAVRHEPDIRILAS